MNVLVLWSHPSGYLHSCLNELAKTTKITALLFRSNDHAPFDPVQFSQFDYKPIWLDGDDPRQDVMAWARNASLSFDLCLVSGWHHSYYLWLIKNHLPFSCVRVLCFDWQWMPTPRNYIKSVYGYLYRSKYFDAAFVPGERQYQFAIRSGFPSERVFQGLYAADVSLIQSSFASNRSDEIIFVGRLVPEKGVDILINAWQELQASQSIPAPWSLHVCGVGPYMEKFSLLPNCYCHGFLQPAQMAEALCRAKILVAPSRVEPWGLQIHEATAAGLVVIATHACGSAVHLVRSEYNGYLISSANPTQLADSIKALVHKAIHSAREFSEMSMNSSKLSQQYSPYLWAKVVHSIYDSLCYLQK